MFRPALLFVAVLAAANAAKIEYWYINMEAAKSRSQCIEKQLKEVGLTKEVHRFPALEFQICEYEFQQCFKDRGDGDCISGGLDWGLTGQHGSKNGDDWKMHHAIVSNWCGHKRLFKKLADAPKDKTVTLEGKSFPERSNFLRQKTVVHGNDTLPSASEFQKFKDTVKSEVEKIEKVAEDSHVLSSLLALDDNDNKENKTTKLNTEIPGDAEYFVVMEDDVVIDQQWFKEVIEDFVDNYNGPQADTWSLVQLDPFGGTCEQHKIGDFRGKPIWQPREGTCPGEGGGFFSFGGRRGDYWGLHAIVLRRSKLKEVVEWMDQSTTLPVDWVPLRMPNSLAYGASIARNPEATRFGWDVQVPSYCSDEIMQTTIGFTQFKKDKDGHLVLK